MNKFAKNEVLTREIYDNAKYDTKFIKINRLKMQKKNIFYNM